MKVRVVLDLEGRQGTYENALRVEVPVPGDSGDHIRIDHENGELRVTHCWATPNEEDVSGEIIWSAVE